MGTAIPKPTLRLLPTVDFEISWYFPMSFDTLPSLGLYSFRQRKGHQPKEDPNVIHINLVWSRCIWSHY
jgi:hypothetical protein